MNKVALLNYKYSSVMAGLFAGAAAAAGGAGMHGYAARGARETADYLTRKSAPKITELEKLTAERLKALNEVNLLHFNSMVEGISGSHKDWFANQINRKGNYIKKLDDKIYQERLAGGMIPDRTPVPPDTAGPMMAGALGTMGLGIPAYLLADAAGM